MESKRFNDALLKAIDLALHSLGKSSKQALYFHLETTFHLCGMEIPGKVEEFDRAIRLIFKGGAVYLERSILEKLCEDLGVKFEEKYVVDFVEAISKLRSMVSERSPFVGLTFQWTGCWCKKRLWR